MIKTYLHALGSTTVAKSKKFTDLAVLTAMFGWIQGLFIGGFIPRGQLTEMRTMATVQARDEDRDEIAILFSCMGLRKTTPTWAPNADAVLDLLIVHAATLGPNDLGILCAIVREPIDRDTSGELKQWIIESGTGHKLAAAIMHGHGEMAFSDWLKGHDISDDEIELIIETITILDPGHVASFPGRKTGTGGSAA